MVKCSCGRALYDEWDVTDLSDDNILMPASELRDEEKDGAELASFWAFDIDDYVMLQICKEAKSYELPILFCPSCGDKLMPDGRVIQRESVPNRIMDMLREVQATCPENGLQEFALKCLNWIEEMREQAGLTGERLSNNAGINRGAYKEFTDNCLNSPGAIYLSTLFKLLNAAQKAQEATDGNPQ